MARAYDNWERLVRATLRREQLRNAGQGHERTPSGIAGAVPPSLTRTTNIDRILQAADEIQEEDPNVARICEPLFSCFISFFFVCFARVMSDLCFSAIPHCVTSIEILAGTISKISLAPAVTLYTVGLNFALFPFHSHRWLDSLMSTLCFGVD